MTTPTPDPCDPARLETISRRYDALDALMRLHGRLSRSARLTRGGAFKNHPSTDNDFSPAELREKLADNRFLAIEYSDGVRYFSFAATEEEAYEHIFSPPDWEPEFLYDLDTRTLYEVEVVMSVRRSTASPSTY